MQRVLERVALADVGVGDAVQNHVHAADRPGAAIQLLPKEAQILRVAAIFGHILLRLNQHAARTDGGVVDFHTLRWLDQVDQCAHHFGGRIELAALLARAVGKILDQILVGRAEQVGKLERAGVEWDGVEVLDERHQRAVVHRLLAHALVEVDTLEHILQRIRVALLDGGQRLVERAAHARLGVTHRLPARILRHKERVLVGVIEQRAAGGFGQSVPLQLARQRCTIHLELVIQMLEKEHPKDILLVLAGIHIAAQNIARLKEQTLQPG
jgi:hypothetical protein